MQENRRTTLTQNVVDRLSIKAHAPAGSTDHIVWDASMPSFGVRLRPSKAAYIVQYRLGRQQRRESLGDCRKITLKDARKAASQRFAKVELGIDPVAEAKGSQRPDLRFGAVADRYLQAKRVDLRPNTWKAAKRYLEVYWKPLHRLRMEEVTQKRVAAELGTIIGVHGRTAAARARGTLSAAISWAMREGLAESNPVIATNDPAAGLQERERVLDDREIRLIWNACREDDFGRIVKLLLLTAARRDEIGGLRLEEIDGAAHRIRLPSERTKAKRAMVLPLAPMAREVLAACPIKDGREFLFGERGGAFSRWSWEKLSMDKRIADTGEVLAPWRLHDLRRTAATRMAELKVPPHVIEAVLNHSLGSKIARTYNRHDYLEEKIEAFHQWAAELHRIIAGGQIIRLPRTA